MIEHLRCLFRFPVLLRYIYLNVVCTNNSTATKDALDDKLLANRTTIPVDILCMHPLLPFPPYCTHRLLFLPVTAPPPHP